MDVNDFKRDVKDWIANHPNGKLDDLRDYCESIIPSSNLTAYTWLVEQTVFWYGHVLSSREWQNFSDGGDEVV